MMNKKYILYTTNIEYDTGEDGYMYQLVEAKTGEENEIGFDQLHFDKNDNLLQLGVDFNDYEQTSYQEEEVSKEEALQVYSELLHTKQNRYNINNPKSKLFELNENEKDTKTLNALTKKYGKDIVLFWLTNGNYGEKSDWEIKYEQEENK